MSLNGIINLLKPAGMTSHDAVAALRKTLRMKKIGHTGTLDPMATGVLPICLGAATRIIEYLEQDVKSYRCEIQLGVETETADIWGNPISESLEKTKDITENQIKAVLATMTGRQQQIPPKYSAIRVDGKRLYEYARKGEDVEIKSRNITIFQIEPVSFELDKGRFMFDVDCSKGTYVRSLCTDIGRALGCGGAMSFLSRTGSGAFNLSNTITLEEIYRFVAMREQICLDEAEKGRYGVALKGDYSDVIYPADFPLSSFGSVELNRSQAGIFGNGGHLPLEQIGKEQVQERALLHSQDEETEFKYKDHYRIYHKNLFLGIGIIDKIKGKLVVDKVFFHENL